MPPMSRSALIGALALGLAAPAQAVTYELTSAALTRAGGLRLDARVTFDAADLAGGTLDGFSFSYDHRFDDPVACCGITGAAAGDPPPDPAPDPEPEPPKPTEEELNQHLKDAVAAKATLRKDRDEVEARTDLEAADKQAALDALDAEIERETQELLKAQMVRLQEELEADLARIVDELTAALDADLESYVEDVMEEELEDAPKPMAPPEIEIRTNPDGFVIPKDRTPRPRNRTDTSFVTPLDGDLDVAVSIVFPDGTFDPAQPYTVRIGIDPALSGGTAASGAIYASVGAAVPAPGAAGLLLGALGALGACGIGRRLGPGRRVSPDRR